MSKELLKMSYESLKDSTVDPNSSDSDWIRLEKFLQTAYFRRSSLLGGETAANRSVLENAKQCVKSVSTNRVATDRAIGLIEDSSDNEMEKIVLLNQLLARAPRAASQLSVGVALFQAELALLRQWDDDRKQQLKELTDGN